MSANFWNRILCIGGVCLLLWLGARYLLPVAVPFLLGGGVALAAEPGIRALQKTVKCPRFPAAALCVSLTLMLTAGVFSLLGAVTVRELGNLAKMAPAVEQGLTVLEDWMITLADRAPDGIRPALINTVTNTFRDGTALVEQVSGKLPGAVASLLGWLSNGALTVGTGILAGFMISARLPKIKAWIKAKLPEKWNDQILPGIRKVKKTFGRWLKAQLKLMGVTWLVVTVGFLLLKVKYAPVWAALVALVDAVPVLGTGTVLIPWAIVRFLQADTLQGVGLLITYGAAWLTRSVLEPRLVGKSLGIDPLISLAAFYAGFKFWGVLGMVLAPMSVALLKGLADSRKPEDGLFKNNL